MNIRDLGEVIIDKILTYATLEDILCSIQYTSQEFKDICKHYTNPTEIDTGKFSFLNTEQICRLIKQSKNLQHFHYNGWKGCIRTDSVVFEYLSAQAKSLNKLSMTRCDLYGDDSLLSLLTCGHQFRELHFDTIHDLVDSFHAIRHCTDFSALRSVEKIYISNCFLLKADVLQRIFAACCNLSHVTILCTNIPTGNDTITFIIQKWGFQLKYLRYNEMRVEKSLKDLANCTLLKELHICRFLALENYYGGLPVMPSVTKLTLERMLLPASAYINILKSFPNLTVLRLLGTGGIDANIGKFLGTCCNLRKLVIIDDRGISKKEALTMFHKFRNVKFIKISQDFLPEMSQNESIKCFGGLQKLHVVTSKYDEPITTRLATWMPQTQIYLSRHTGSLLFETQPKRILPGNEICRFQQANVTLNFINYYV